MQMQVRYVVVNEQEWFGVAMGEREEEEAEVPSNPFKGIKLTRLVVDSRRLVVETNDTNGPAQMMRLRSYDFR